MGLVTFITNIIGALPRPRMTWRTRRHAETKPARSAKRPARATWAPATAFKKSVLVQLSAGSMMTCDGRMDAAIRWSRLLRRRLAMIGGASRAKGWGAVE